MDIKQIGIRGGFVAISLVLWFWTQKIISRKAPKTDGVGDQLHVLTAPLNAWLHANPRAANLTLIISSLGIDLCGVFLLVSAIFGDSLRPFIALLILFGLRQTCQLVTTLPAPPGILWRHPGVPSLLVTYDVGNDFYFSGHTAIAVLAAFELAHTGNPWFAAVGIFVAVGEAATVLILRAHYTMDIFTAAFVAWAAQKILIDSNP
ncbi:MAG: phosphatase PAP2 family protein [Pedosphaera sp.]|nr:phosphatase PAP2 family protein [Pedosphaera sp.]